MHQTILCRWVLKGALALAVVAGGVSDAAAGWGSNGSWGGGSMGGGSSGGWGGSAGYSAGWGSTGGYGSSGGGMARRGLFHHHRAARFGGGSSGGWGSTGGGSSGGWGSSGGYGWSGGSSGGGFAGGGSSGGWGSSGGDVMGGGYYSPSYAPSYSSPSYIVPEGDQPVNPPPPPMNPPVDGDPLPPMGDAPVEDGTSLRRADGTLVVEVPADAKIYVNNRLTSTPGEVREYVSKNLIRGYNYTYEVRAELEIDGKTVTETKKIDLRAGQHQKLAFNLNPAASEVETSITVKVPANAKVNLGGNDTNAQGETRVYRTSALRDGAEWKDYKIVVTAEVDGREITKEQSFDLKAGENKELHFDFDAASVADLR